MIYLVKNIQSSDITGLANWEASETIQTGKTGQAIALPDYSGIISDMFVAMIPNGGSTGKIQKTVSSIVDVKNGVANWVDWSAGNKTVNTIENVYNITAVRGVSVSGIIKIEVRAS